MLKRFLPLGLLGALVVPSHAAAPPTGYPWRGTATGIERSEVYSQGELISTNTLRLAKGANSDNIDRDQYFANVGPDAPGNMSGDIRRALTYGFFGMYRSAHNGDYQLPSDPAQWPDGTGEITEVRFAVSAGDLVVRVQWNTYPRAEAQIASIVFNSKSGSAAKPWPANAKLSSPWDAVLTLSGPGAVLTTEQGDQPVPSFHVGHFTEARVPLSALPAGIWFLQGGSGLADPADPTRYWEVAPGPASATAPGSGGPLAPTNVWGLLFQERGTWWFDEKDQARQLMSGLLSGGTSLDPGLIGGQPNVTIPTGDLSRIYASRYDGGDGIQRSAGVADHPPVPDGVPIGHDFDVTYTFTGRLQDYGMRVPAAYTPAKKWPLILYLHGFGADIDEPFRLPLGLVDTAEEKGYLLASLHGRGDLFYRPGLGELDVMEALADVRAHYNVDPDRIYLMGHSMGGYGTNNIATRHPDLFAAVVPAEGTDATSLVGNLRNLPWFGITADEDLDPQGAAMHAHYDAISALGYDATLLHYHFKTHEYSSIYDTLPRLFAFFGAHRRVADPAVVTWVRPPASEDHPDLEQVHDGAYWVGDVDAGTVTVESMAIPHRVLDPAAAKRISAVEIDEGGPTMRTTAQLSQTTPVPGAALPVGNTLKLTTHGTGRLSVSVAGAHLSLTGLRIESDTDQPVVLALRPGPTLTLPAGKHSAVLGIGDVRSRPPLPSTGAAPTLAWLGGVAVAGALGVRRVTVRRG